VIARAPGTRTHTYARACLALGLTVEGMSDEAIAVSEGLLTAADATHNPFVASMALLAYGFAYRDADPDRALGALRRGLVIARDSGNRFIESHLAVGLSRLAATHGDPLDAFEFLTVAIRNFYDSGSFSIMASPLAVLAAFFDRLGHHQPAATISGFASTPLTRTAFPEINTTIAHLREVLGDQAYEAIAHKGEAMTTAAMAAYAFEQIDQARASLGIGDRSR
jgi:hypothetical protein